MTGTSCSASQSAILHASRPPAITKSRAPALCPLDGVADVALPVGGEEDRHPAVEDLRRRLELEVAAHAGPRLDGAVVVARRVEPFVEAGHRLVVPVAPVGPVAAVAEPGLERRVVDDHRGPGVDQHLFDGPPVEADERRLARDGPALRHGQGRGDAVGAGHRDVLAGGVDGRRRLQVGVEAALLAGVVGHAHRPDLDEPEPRDGVEEPRVDVPPRRVHDLGLGRRLHVRSDRGDPAVADDHGSHERLAGQGVHGAAMDRVGLGGGGGGAEGGGG